MANFSTPNGLSPVGMTTGAPWNQQARLYQIPQADGSAYYIGDAVKSAAGIDTTSGQFAPAIAKAAAGNTLRGVIVSFQLPSPTLYAQNNFDPTILSVPATKTKDYFAWVVDDQNVIFEMTDDGITTGNLVATAVGKNANFTVAAPSGISQQSATVILSSSIATTSTLPLKIIGLKAVAGNSAAPFARWLVRINAHEFFGLTAGV